ncbi:MAG: histidine phosphatase family protein [Bacillales bacterium]|nr:histidine phosphatase family protein [Bacillales bacterium]
MTTVYFVRHGQTKENAHHLIQGRKNFPLSEKGKVEIKKTGLYLKNNSYNIDVIYSSPLDRAVESAKIIKEIIAIKKDVIIEDGLIERDFGKAEGIKISPKVYHDILHDSYSGMEKALDIENRMLNTTKKIIKENAGKTILVVSHSHAIKALLCALDEKRKFTSPLNNASLTKITEENGILEIVYSNKVV